MSESSVYNHAQVPTQDSLSVVILLLRRRKSIVRGALLGAFIAIAAGMTRSTTYTSRATFLAEGKRGQSGASALAAQFGLSVSTGDVSFGPAYYAELLKSRVVLERVASLRMESDVARGNASGMAVSDVFGIEESDSLLRLERTIAALDAALAVNLSVKTGIIQIAVRSSSPKIARALLSAIYSSVNVVNIQLKQAQAGAEGRFASARLAQLQVELREAEDREREFLRNNRDYRNSPQLALDRDRLARDVAFKQQLFGAIAQTVEQARLDQSRDTPVLAILDEPSIPASRDGRGLRALAIVGCLFGLILTALVAVLRWSLQAAVPEDELHGSSTLRELTKEFVTDLQRPWRLVV